MARALGTKILLVEKVCVGFTLMLLVLLLLAGPMLLFSTINPISRSNLVSYGALEFSI
jgi:hypothetical protein